MDVRGNLFNKSLIIFHRRRAGIVREDAFSVGRSLSDGNSGSDLGVKDPGMDLRGKLLGHLKNIPGQGCPGVKPSQKYAQDIESGVKGTAYRLNGLFQLGQPHQA